MTIVTLPRLDVPPGHLADADTATDFINGIRTSAGAISNAPQFDTLPESDKDRVDVILRHTHIALAAIRELARHL